MRRSAQNITLTGAVRPMPGMDRPVRLQLGGLVYLMTPDEAIDLANQLADATEQLRIGATP